MACENLSKYYPIVMKFSRYLPLYKDTSAIDFEPDGSNLLAGHGPKVGHNELHCCSVWEWDRNSQGCYRYVSLNNLVIAVPKMGQMSWSGIFPECHIFLVSRLFCHPCVTEKEPSLTKKLPEAIVPKVGHRPKMGENGFDHACAFVVFLFLLCFIAHSFEADGGTDTEVLACFRPDFLIKCILGWNMPNK